MYAVRGQGLVEGWGSVAEAAVRAVKHSFQAILTSAVNIGSCRSALGGMATNAFLFLFYVSDPENRQRKMPLFAFKLFTSVKDRQKHLWSLVA